MLLLLSRLLRLPASRRRSAHPKLELHWLYLSRWCASRNSRSSIAGLNQPACRRSCRSPPRCSPAFTAKALPSRIAAPSTPPRVSRPLQPRQYALEHKGDLPFNAHRRAATSCAGSFAGAAAAGSCSRQDAQLLLFSLALAIARASRVLLGVADRSGPLAPFAGAVEGDHKNQRSAIAEAS